MEGRKTGKQFVRWKGSDFEEGEESLSNLHGDDKGARQRYFVQKVKPDVLKENCIGLSMGDQSEL